MRSTIASPGRIHPLWRAPLTVLAILLALVFVGQGTALCAAEIGRTFDSPEDAAQALAAAAAAKDRQALREIFGPASEELQMSDRVQADEEFEAFSAAFRDSHRISGNSGLLAVLEVGPNHWPFPVPLVQENGKWHFDTEAGKQEIMNRRVGRNELSALNTMRAYVEAQREYASRDRDGDEVLEYAQQILSSPDRKDGLYWSPELDGEMSPLGPLVADAQAQGYTRNTGDKSGPKPFHGYQFMVLTRQGSHAPGSKYNYIINGNMIGGFALVAWPADYGNSGVMTFIVNQQGKVYQKDLGPNTAKIAGSMREYEPDPTWSQSRD